MKDRLLSPGTVSALCSARLTLVSPERRRDRRGKEERERGREKEEGGVRKGAHSDSKFKFQNIVISSILFPSASKVRSLPES